MAPGCSKAVIDQHVAKRLKFSAAAAKNSEHRQKVLQAMEVQGLPEWKVMEMIEAAH